MLLVLAAFGALFLNLVCQEKRTLLPKPVMFVHVAIVAIGLILLIVAAVVPTLHDLSPIARSECST